MTSSLLPPGASSLERACAGHGWLLVAKERTAWGWSPVTGWHVLPPTCWKIEELGVVEGGFLATLDSGKAIGFWRAGAKDWGWWRDARSCVRELTVPRARWRADGSLVALQVAYDADETCVLFRLRDEGIERLRSFPLRGLGELRGVEDRGEQAARILCENGIAAAPLRSGRVEVERWVPIVGDEARVLGGLVLNGPGRFTSSPPVTHVVDLGSGALSERPWPAGPGLRLLQEAAARGETGRLRDLIEFLALLPPQPGLGDEILAVLDGPAGPLAAAKQAGILTRTKADGNEAGGGLPPGSPLRRDLLPLALLTDPEEVAPFVAEEILKGRSPAAELAFATVFGEGATRKLADALRGRKALDHYDSSDVRRLFGRSGPGTRELVRDLLAEDDPACRLLGAVAAGEPALELAPSLSGSRRNPDDLVLRQQFLATLRHPAAIVRAAALDSCATLRVSGVSPEVADRFRSDDATVRAVAAGALCRLDDDAERERGALGGAMAFEEARVRIQIVEEIRSSWRATDVDMVVRALGDPSDRVRYEAWETLAERAWELDVRSVLAALDAWLLTALGNRAAVARGKLQTPLHSSSFAEALGKGFASDDPPEPVLASPRVAPTIVTMLVLAPVLEAVSTGADWSPLRVNARDLVGGAVEWLEGIAPGIGPLLPAILAVGRDKEPSASLSVLSGQLAAWSPEHSDRAAIAALMRAREEGRGREASPAPAAGNIPLAARLSRLGRTDAGLADCRRRVLERAREKDALGLAALLALALGDDADARRELLRRVEAAEVEPWWTAATAFAQASDDEETRSLLRRVVRSSAIPPGRKAQVAEALGEMDASLTLVDDPVHVDLAEEIALSKGAFPLARRAKTSWELGKAGRVAPLEALWKELDEYEPTAASARYEVALGLARGGRTEHFDVVRGRWLDEWDLRPVELLAEFGDETDLPALEKAKERHAPGSGVDAAIAAIRERAGRA